jgi:serralysin
VAGKDLLRGENGDDWLYPGLGGDTADGGDGDDTLFGGYGDDELYGDNGNDLPWGDAGNDAMSGGAGADTFLFTAFGDFPSYDIITDFEHGVDKIDLRGIDARPDIAGDTGEVEYRHDGGYTCIFLATGDGEIDSSIRLDGTITLTAVDFLL